MKIRSRARRRGVDGVPKFLCRVIHRPPVALTACNGGEKRLHYPGICVCYRQYCMPQWFISFPSIDLFHLIGQQVYP